ncbi:MAG: ATP-dependent Clp protease ATP-binding subunit, partial [Chryseobacterium sp.]
MSVLITNETIKEVFHIAQSVARENYNAQYGASHLLQALLHNNFGLKEFLLNIEKDPGYIYEWAEVRVEEYPKTTHLPDEISQDEKIKIILEEADDIRSKLGLDEVTPLCLLAAIAKPNIAFSVQELKSFPLREHEILNVFRGEDKKVNLQESSLTGTSSPDKSAFPAISSYCVDKTEQARDGKLDNIVGRDKELRMLIEILCRRTKPNVIIVGEPGVGKTALLEGFAIEINKGNVPEMLKEATLLELDTGSLLAGTSYKGEIEDRLKKVINECKKINKAVLFIDEIHSLLDSKGSAGNVANLLKPELARGEITVIGATTQEEYRKIIEPERAFDRRFEVLNVEEPDEITCVKMIDVLLDGYKNHHKVEVDRNALADCVSLAKRYSKGKKLPDSAIDLLDRTMASIKMLDELSETELKSWKENYDQIISESDETDPLLADELIWNFNLLQNKLSPILWGSLSEQHTLETSMDIGQIKKVIDSTFEELIQLASIKREKVGKLELAAVMAAKTGIPIGKIQAKEKEKLLNME